MACSPLSRERVVQAMFPGTDRNMTTPHGITGERTESGNEYTA